MKPYTAFSGLTRWVLRIAMLLVIFTQHYDTFMAFKINSLTFYIAAVYIIFGVLLLIGGFVNKHNFTVLSGLLLLLASIYMCFVSFDGVTSEFALYVLLGSVALIFVTDGNK